MADLARNKSHLVIVNGIVEKEGKILVSQRSFEETHQPGAWSIPGGKIERTKGDEWNIVEKSLKREIMEETGIEISDEVKLITNNTFIRSTGHHVVALIFLCHWKSGIAKPLEDTINVKWVTKDDLNSLDFSPGVKEYIQIGFSSIKIP